MGNEYICDYFNHNPAQIGHGELGHIHECSAPGNVTGRCGFNDIKDSKYCTLYSDLNRRTKL